MAKRAPNPVTPPPRAKVTLTASEMARGIDRLEDRIGELSKYDINAVTTPDNPPAIIALEASIERTLAKIFGEDTADYRRYQLAAQLSAEFMMAFEGYPAVKDYRETITGHIDRSVQLLREAQRGLNEELEDEAERASRRPPSPSPAGVAASNKVFVVHGHDEAALQSVARFLERMGLEAIILKEQPNQGRTIIEKFEASSEEVGFAVVLLTPDDVGAAVSAAVTQTRARQNVVFELGYFAGKLGRGKVCLLRSGNVEIPSDLYGVIYTELDPAEGWKTTLVKEMKAAKLKFDANRLWG